MKLYYMQRTRATRARWILEELGIPYELAKVDLEKAEHKSSEYLKIHPFGSVPALEDGDLKMFESAAIVLYLADRYPEAKLAPALDQRAHYYQWAFYAMSTLEPMFVEIFSHVRYLPEELRSEGIMNRAKERAENHFKVLEDHFATRSYVLGDAFSAVDVIFASLLQWGMFLGVGQNSPNIKRYVELCTSRPAFIKSRQD